MGVEPPNSGDRRVQRTRRALREALVELTLERGWDAVSVQQICDRADIGRSTFYNHFGDKEDLLVDGLDDLKRHLRGLGADAAPLAFARGMIEHAHEQRRLFRAVIGKRGGQVIQRRFRRLLIGLVQEDLAALLPPGPEQDACAHYLAGAFFELLTWWIDTRNSYTPADVERLFHELASPTLAVLRRRR